MSSDLKEYLKNMIDSGSKDRDLLSKYLNWDHPEVVKIYASWQDAQKAVTANMAWNRKQLVTDVINGKTPFLDRFIACAVDSKHYLQWVEFKKNKGLHNKSPYKDRIEFFLKEPQTGTPTLESPLSSTLSEKNVISSNIIVKEEKHMSDVVLTPSKKPSDKANDALLQDFKADSALLQKDIDILVKSSEKTPRLVSNVKSSWKRLEATINELTDGSLN